LIIISLQAKRKETNIKFLLNPKKLQKNIRDGISKNMDDLICQRISE